MDIIEIAKRMNHRINELNTKRKELEDLSIKKAQSLGNYEKVIALTIMKLRNGFEMELDGEKVKNPQTTVTEKIAKGICFQEKIDAELAESKYKLTIVSMEAIKAELNGYQSISKHLSEI